MVIYNIVEDDDLENIERIIDETELELKLCGLVDDGFENIGEHTKNIASDTARMFGGSNMSSDMPSKEELGNMVNQIVGDGSIISTITDVMGSAAKGNGMDKEALFSACEKIKPIMEQTAEKFARPPPGVNVTEKL